MDKTKKKRTILLFIILVAIGGLVLFGEGKNLNPRLEKYGIKR